MEIKLDYANPKFVNVGEVVYDLLIAHSEVAMHMRIAGTFMRAKLLPSEGHGAIVQLYKDGKEFSAPILTGEAGFYRSGGFNDTPYDYYYYPPLPTPEPKKLETRS